MRGPKKPAKFYPRVGDFARRRGDGALGIVVEIDRGSYSIMFHTVSGGYPSLEGWHKIDEFEFNTPTGIPTSEQVRQAYIDAASLRRQMFAQHYQDAPVPDYGAQFDRWLLDHDVKVGQALYEMGRRGAAFPYTAIRGVASLADLGVDSGDGSGLASSGGPLHSEGPGDGTPKRADRRG